MRPTHSMLMESTDENLVKQAQAGDGVAFGQLLERHYDLVFRLSFRMLGNCTDAEDLAQDICAALPGKLKGFRGEAKFTTWLYRVASNAAIDRMRKRARRRKASDSWGEVEVLERANEAAQREEMEWLSTAMATLGAELRQTVALVLGEDMTHAEAGRVLDVSEGTISWRMSEVKKSLRALAEEGERSR